MGNDFQLMLDLGVRPGRALGRPVTLAGAAMTNDRSQLSSVCPSGTSNGGSRGAMSCRPKAHRSPSSAGQHANSGNGGGGGTGGAGGTHGTPGSGNAGGTGTGNADSTNGGPGSDGLGGDAFNGSRGTDGNPG